MVQNSQKCIQKGHFESWAPIGSWNLFYDKRCVFSKESIWHRSFQPEPAGNWWKNGISVSCLQVLSSLTLHFSNLPHIRIWWCSGYHSELSPRGPGINSPQFHIIFSSFSFNFIWVFSVTRNPRFESRFFHPKTQSKTVRSISLF